MRIDKEGLKYRILQIKREINLSQGRDRAWKYPSDIHHRHGGNSEQKYSSFPTRSLPVLNSQNSSMKRLSSNPNTKQLNSCDSLKMSPEQLEVIDMIELFGKEPFSFQIFAKNVSDINKRYFQKLQQISAARCQETDLGLLGIRQARLKSRNCFQMHRLHETTIDFAEDSDTESEVNSSQLILSPQQSSYSNSLREGRRFMKNCLSHGPLSSNSINHNNSACKQKQQQQKSNTSACPPNQKHLNHNGYTLADYENGIKALQQAIQSNDSEEVFAIYETNFKEIEEVDEQEAIKCGLDLIRDQRMTGWNCLHCVCFWCGDTNDPQKNAIFMFITEKCLSLVGAHARESLEIVNERKRALASVVTSCDYTALQLSAKVNSVSGVKFLIESLQADYNQRTKYGTAFHLATSHGNNQVIRYLLTKTEIDDKILNENEQTAIQVATQESLKYINDNSRLFLRLNPKERIKKESFMNGIPEKPSMIRGKVQKLHVSFISSSRILEINPDLCSLVFYGSPSDVPNKPLDIYPMKDISRIERIPPSFLMKKSQFYIKIYYAEEIVIALKNESTCQLWLHHLKTALEYCKFVEQKITSYVFTQNIAKLERSFLFLSLVGDQDKIISLEDKLRASDTRKKQQPATASAKPNEKSTNASPAKDTTICRSQKESLMDFSGFGMAESDISQAAAATASVNASLSSSLKKQKCFLKLRDFLILDIIGSGAFGRVFLAQMKHTFTESNDNSEDLIQKKHSNDQTPLPIPSNDPQTCQYVALKSLKKHQLKHKNNLRYAQTELSILKQANHPFIIKLHASFQTEQYIFMVLEYCSGGDLGLILAQKNGMMEQTIKFIIAQVILAIEYLHASQIVYRDLKPENILIGEDGYIKLADFGLSRENISDNEICSSFCGSPAYISPEQLLRIGATKKTDIYGIGCIMYEMYSGQPPFYSLDLNTLFENIKHSPITFNNIPSFSPESQDLIQKMVSKDYETRPTISEVKAHPYFKGVDWVALKNKAVAVPVEILECIDVDCHLSSNYSNSTIFKDIDYESSSDCVESNPSTDHKAKHKMRIHKWSFVNDESPLFTQSFRSTQSRS